MNPFLFRPCTAVGMILLLLAIHRAQEVHSYSYSYATTLSRNIPLTVLPSLSSRPQQQYHQQYQHQHHQYQHQTTITSLFSSTTSQQELAVPIEMIQTDSVICGGGPAGLLTAIMLAQKFPKQQVKVYDRLQPPPSATNEAIWEDVAKFYLIGLGSRGQLALNQFGVWNEVEDVCTAVKGRKDWSPESSDKGTERIFTDRPVDTQVLPRDKLVAVLYQHIQNNYATQIELNYGYKVEPLDFEAGDGTQVVIQVSKCKEDTARLNPITTSTLLDINNNNKGEADMFCVVDETFVVSTSLLIAADGTARTIANRMEEDDRSKRKKMNVIQRILAGKPFQVTRYVDDNIRIYKTIPMQIPHDWRHDLNYSARSKGARVTYDALPANRKGTYCGVLLLKKDDPMAQPNSDPAELRKLFDDALPQFSRLLNDDIISVVAKKAPSFLPSFRYVGPRLNQGKRTILLGDCAHTVKPYFGLGANSALEDVKILSAAIDSCNGDLSQAVQRFSQQRAGDSKALVRISRELDRPGVLGFITFILPIILDAVFHGMAPIIFAPNTISMLQREGIGFQQVARRKRYDRIGQVAILGSATVSMFVVAKFLVSTVAKALGKRSSTVFSGMLGLLVVMTLLQKLTGFLVPGMAPADIMTKTNTMRNDDTFLTPMGMRKPEQPINPPEYDI